MLRISDMGNKEFDSFKSIYRTQFSQYLVFLYFFIGQNVSNLLYLLWNIHDEPDVSLSRSK